MNFKQWNGFKGGDWKQEINVRDFIQNNYTPYDGDSNFLEKTTEKTDKLWNEVLELYKKEHESEGGVLDIDTKTISTVSAHDAGYIDKDLEEIVGLQTDKPLKRAIMPFGGIRIVEKSCEAYGRKVDDEVENIFHHYRKTPYERLKIGQKVNIVVKCIDRESGKISLSYKENFGTWEENVENFRAGEKVQGIVRDTEKNKNGIFIELSPNLVGMAEYKPGFRYGQKIEVYIKKIDYNKRKVKLFII